MTQRNQGGGRDLGLGKAGEVTAGPEVMRKRAGLREQGI